MDFPGHHRNHRGGLRHVEPGVISLGNPGVLKDLFTQAGLVDAEVHAVPAPHRMASAADYVQVAREAFGGFNAMMAQLPALERDAVWNEVEASMRIYESVDGFDAPGECWVGAASK